MPSSKKIMSTNATATVSERRLAGIQKKKDMAGNTENGIQFNITPSWLVLINTRHKNMCHYGKKMSLMDKKIRE